tara:strand:- start:1187 stop:1462 length:276 start_codon:yes stop_codon:yes gene_type:complete
MYAIVKNVVTPAINSVLKLVLFFLYSKYLSNINPPIAVITLILKKNPFKILKNLELQLIRHFSVYKICVYSKMSCNEYKIFIFNIDNNFAA